MNSWFALAALKDHEFSQIAKRGVSDHFIYGMHECIEQKQQFYMLFNIEWECDFFFVEHLDCLTYQMIIVHNEKYN